MITKDEAQAMICTRLERRCQKKYQITFLSCEAVTPEQARERYGGKFIGVCSDAIVEAVEIQYALRIRTNDRSPSWCNWEIRCDLVVLFVSSPLLLE